MFDEPRSARLAGGAERRAARGRHARGRPAADPRRGGHRQDHDAVRARRLAAVRGRARRADPAADVHAARGARDGRSARAGARRAGRAATRAGSWAARFTRSPTGWCACTPSSLGLDPGFGVLDAGDAADLLDLVREERGHAASRRRFPRAQTMLDIYSRTVNAQTPLAEVLAESLPVVRGASRRARRDLPRVRRPQARARRARSRRPAALLARARRRRGDRAAHGRRASSTCSWTSTRTSTACRSTSCAACAPRSRELTVVGDDFQAIYGFRAASARHILDFPEQFPDAHTRHARAQLPLDRADPRGRQRGLRAGPAGLSEARCGPSASGGSPPELVFPRDESEQASEVCDRVLAAREEGMELRTQAVLFRTGHDSDLLELELTRRGDPVRQVRRPALPRRGARQGPDRAAAADRQPRRRGQLVSPAAAARRCRARARPARARGAAAARRRSAASSDAGPQAAAARPRGLARARARA